MHATPQTALSLGDIRLADQMFWMMSDAEREGAFALLRAERPVSWHEEFEYPGIPKGPGSGPSRAGKTCGR